MGERLYEFVRDEEAYLKSEKYSVPLYLIGFAYRRLLLGYFHKCI